MIDINKTNEPDALKRFKRHNRGLGLESFDDLESGVKRKIKKTLLKEQGHVCCYCMSRIAYESMRVEHFKSQSNHPTLRLDYGNMLAACNGNSSKSHECQHCDTFKGQAEITCNPSKEHIESTISYLSDGTIKSSNAKWNEELNNTLNLNSNMHFLKRNRKSIKDAIDTALCSKKLTKQKIIEFLSKNTTKDKDGKLIEYCGVAVYFLKKRLRSFR
ncbi:MAG TPA: retron system putative HNH endonuclease [Nitratidesulfovibrio sp.]|nr:retron system putative HNH endonuclease [Nitratidesulfovibrio sp.]